MDMATLIVERRKAKGLTQKQLAEQLGVTDKAVSKWERGNGYPDISYLEPLAGALGLTVSELLKGKTENPGQEASGGDEETIVKSTLDYAGRVQEAHSKSIPRIAVLSFFALGLAGIITTAIVDFALNGGFTWSLLPISAILFSWLCVAPLLFFKKRRADMVLLSISIFVFPFLYVVARLTGGGWFARVAVPVTVAGLVVLWLIRLVFATRLSIWNKLAASLLVGGVANIAIEFMVGRILNDGGFDVWNLMALAILVVIAIILFAVGRARSGR